MISTNGDAWLRIGASHASEAAGNPKTVGEKPGATPDLYDGRLGRLRVPVLVIHGARDPRTEPGELDALRQALEISRKGMGHRRQAGAGADGRLHSQFEILSDGGHSPHSERATADKVTRLAARFLSS
jgi:pimeloyl-ACP methyl ester carboxylesterase